MLFSDTKKSRKISMKFIKKILIPFDFSEPSFNALNYGIKMANKFDAKIDLLCHINDKVYNMSNNLVDKDLSFSTSEKLKKTDENIQKIIQRPDCVDLVDTYTVKSGDEIKNIIEHEKKNSIDFVIVGAFETNTSDREKLVRLSICPVIIVKHFCSFDEGIKHILFASDFDKNTPTIANFLKLFTSVLQAQIHLLRINTWENFLHSSQSEQRMLKFKARNGLNKCTLNVYDHSIVEEGIMEFTSKINIDLLALVTHGRSQISQWFSPSVTEELVHRINAIPIITFNIEIENRKEYIIKPLPQQNQDSKLKGTE